MNKIIQWNVRNLCSNKGSIEHMLSELEPSILCLQETGGKSNSNLNLCGLNLISFKNREGASGGGVAIYAKNSVSIVPVVIDSSLEVCAARIFLGNLSFTLLSLYLPPSIGASHIIENIQTIFNTMPGPFLVCSDANAHHLGWGSPSNDRRGEQLYDFCCENDLLILNNCNPTFECSNGNFTHIDITFCSDNISHSFSWDTWHDVYHSDHYPICIDIPSEETNFNSSPKLNIKKANWCLYQSSVKLPVGPYSDAAKLCSDLEKSISDAAYISVPLSPANYNPKFSKSWWNVDCQNALKNKRAAYRKYKKSLGNLGDWVYYRKTKAILKYHILNAKRTSFKKFVSSLNNHSPSTLVWRKIQRLRGSSWKHRRIIIGEGDCYIAEPNRVSEKLVKNFVMRGALNEIDPSFKFEIENNCPPIDYSAMPEYNQPFNIKELLRALNKRCSGCPGPDKINPELITNLPYPEKLKLLDIFNFFWCSGLPPQ